MALTDKLTAIGDAIREKTGTKGIILLSDMPKMISAISGTGGSIEPFVQFYGRSGKVLFKYTLSEFADRTVMPTPPIHVDGCTFQGWNYDIETIKAMNSHVNVAAIYSQDDDPAPETPELVKTYVDGTKLYLHIEEPLTIQIYYRQSVKNGVTMYWGDGESYVAEKTGSNLNPTHDYAPGDYVITFEIAENCVLSLGAYSTSYSVMGNCSFDGTWVPRQQALVKAEIDLRNTYPSQSAFRCCQGLKEVTFGCGKSYALQNYMFDQCYNLEDVHLCNDITELGDYSFRLCYRLKHIEIPRSVQYLKTCVFNDCRRLRSIHIPASVTRIYSSAFTSCMALQEVEIEPGVKTIDSSAFSSCYSLRAIHLPNTITTMGTSVFTNCYAIQNVALPKSLTAIPNNLFQSCYSLQSVTIPEGVTSIGASVFTNCYSLAFVGIPKSVKTIGTSAFSVCESLRNAVFGSSLTSIGDTCFQNCYSLEYIVLPPSVTSIGVAPFSGCTNLKNIVLPEALHGMTSVFASTQLQNETLRAMYEQMLESCSEIRNYAFDGCGYLDEAALPATAKRIGDYAFRNNTVLRKITMPSTVDSIGAEAFHYCRNLERADIPSGVTTIGNYAFDRCMHLKKAVIPASVKTIGSYFFSYCYGLEEVELKSAMLTAAGCAFYFDVNLRKVTFPKTVVSVALAENCFYGTGLQRFEGLPNNIYFTNSGGLAYCYSLEYADIGGAGATSTSGMTSLFSNDYSLESVILPRYVTSIGSSMFQNCYALSDYIEIPKTVMTIGSSAFYDCRTLKGVVFLGNDVTTISSNAFQNCYSMREIRLPYSLTSLSTCFSGCYNLSRIYSYALKPPTGTTSIGSISSKYTIYVPKGSRADYEKQWSSHLGHFEEFCFITPKYPAISRTLGKLSNSVSIKNGFVHTALSEGQDFTASYSVDGTNIKEITDFNLDVDTGLVSFSFVRNDEMDFTVTDRINIHVGVADTDIGCDLTVDLKYIDSEVTSEYTVNHVAGYVFTDIGDGLYQSTNQGKHSTFCLCRVDFSTSTGKLFLDCSGEGESNCDFGLVSELDMPLVASTTADSGAVLKKSFSGLGKYSMTLDYDVPDTDQHSVYIKYRKDGSVNTGADCLRFQVRFE